MQGQSISYSITALGGGHLLGFAGALWVWIVADHIHVLWCRRADGVDHLAQGVGAVPGNQEEWGVHLMVRT